MVVQRNAVIRKRALTALQDAAEEKFGPAPVNPLRKARQFHPRLKDFTLDQFADLCGITKQALIRCEQAVFTEPLEPVLRTLVEQYNFNELQLVNGYEDFQHLQRERYPRIFGEPPTYDPMRHPLSELRGLIGRTEEARITLTELSKDWCIPQSTLEYWEKNASQQKSVPAVFGKVWRVCGYTSEEFTNLQVAYEAHRVWLGEYRGFKVVQNTSIPVLPVGKDISFEPVRQTAYDVFKETLNDL